MLAQFKKFELSKSQQQKVQGGTSAYGTAINVTKVAIDVLNTMQNGNETTQSSSSTTTTTQQLPQTMNAFNTYTTLQQNSLKQLSETLKGIAQNIG
ncbi:hypothetical protein [Runella zeae]|uniref:hypothetical protein n=1 Tax=Runella zeae TaxID=94255 RepID=UPI00040CE7C3|nr:hypothetical protein [Runella zeae]